MEKTLSGKKTSRLVSIFQYVKRHSLDLTILAALIALNFHWGAFGCAVMAIPYIILFYRLQEED